MEGSPRIAVIGAGTRALRTWRPFGRVPTASVSGDQIMKWWTTRRCSWNSGVKPRPRVHWSAIQLPMGAGRGCKERKANCSTTRPSGAFPCGGLMRLLHRLSNSQPSAPTIRRICRSEQIGCKPKRTEITPTSRWVPRKHCGRIRLFSLQNGPGKRTRSSTGNLRRPWWNRAEAGPSRNVPVWGD
jgi:hypothetical protein